MSEKIFNIPFTLEFMEIVDIDTMTICEGIFSGFKISKLKDGILFFKNIGGTLVSTKIEDENFFDNNQDILKNISQMAVSKTTKCVEVGSGLDEYSILKSFVGKFSDQCAEKIWSLALGNFKCKDEKRRLFNFNKRSIPEEMLHMPALFYTSNVCPDYVSEKTISNFGKQGYKQTEKIKFVEKTNTVLKEIEQSIQDNVYAKSRLFVKQNEKYMDKDAQMDLENQTKCACSSFFKLLEKNVATKSIEQ